MQEGQKARAAVEPAPACCPSLPQPQEAGQRLERSPRVPPPPPASRSVWGCPARVGRDTGADHFALNPVLQQRRSPSLPGSGCQLPKETAPGQPGQSLGLPCLSAAPTGEPRVLSTEPAPRDERFGLSCDGTRLELSQEAMWAALAHRARISLWHLGAPGAGHLAQAVSKFQKVGWHTHSLPRS